MATVRVSTNFGIACYFNSLLQIYFMIPALVEAVMMFKIDDETLASLQEEEKKAGEGSNKVVEKRIRESKKLILELQKLFA